MGIFELLKKLELHDVQETDEYGNTALHRTINDEALTQKEIVEVFEMLLDRGLDPNTKNKDHQTVLHLVVAYMMRDVVDCLLSRKCNADFAAYVHIENQYDTFREWSKNKNNTDQSNEKIQKFESDSADFTEWMISRGFDFDSKLDENQSAFLKAINYNLQHLLPVLLKYTEDINFVDEKKRTLLHMFIEKNDEDTHRIGNKNWYSDRYIVDIVKILLDRGVSIDSEDYNGKTSTELAILQAKNISVAEMLLEQSTKIKCKDKYGRSLLQKVIESSILVGESKREYYVQIIRSLIAKGADINELHVPNEYGRTILCRAVACENMPLINFLEENGSDFNIVTRDGENLLHQLARGKEVKLVDLFVSKGCQVNAKDSDGNTPLHAAATHDNVAMARKLIEHGADVNCKRRDGTTPLHIATLVEENIPMMELLRGSGADFNVTTEDGENLMHQLAKRRFYNRSDKVTALFKLLVSGGCQVNAKNRSGSSPLHVAATHADSTTIRILIECGADVNARNNEKQTPLHVSTTNIGTMKVGELLLVNGANVNAKDSKGRTALHKAAMEAPKRDYSSVPFGVLLFHGVDFNAPDTDGLTAICHARIRDSEDHDQKCREYVQKFNEVFVTNADNHMAIGYCRVRKEASSTVQLLTAHAVKLKTAKFPLNETINVWLEELSPFTGIWHFYTEYYGEYPKELEKLKSNLIDNRTSLHDWLYMGLNKRCAYVKNQKLNNLVRPPTFARQVQGMHLRNYSVLISANYNEALTRKSLLQPAKEALMQLTKTALPDLCAECIFSFLSNADLFSIIEEY